MRRMRIQSSIMLIVFPHGLKIRYVHKQSKFYQSSEMDGPQAIELDYFIGASESDGMFQQPGF